MDSQVRRCNLSVFGKRFRRHDPFVVNKRQLPFEEGQHALQDTMKLWKAAVQSTSV